LSNIRSAATSALRVLRGSLDPDEVKLSFSVKMTVEAGAVIARTALEGNIGVEMLWRNDPSQQDAGRSAGAS
jgi:hypothetical protein